MATLRRAFLRNRYIHRLVRTGTCDASCTLPEAILQANTNGGGDTIAAKVNNLVAATEELLDRLAIPRSIAEMGIPEEEFARALPDMATNAFDDPSWRSNPRMPLVSELIELFWNAYEGRSAAKTPTVTQEQIA